MGAKLIDINCNAELDSLAMKKQSRNFLHEVIEAAGGSQKVANAFGISCAAVSRWKAGQQIPADRAVKLAGMTRGRFKPSQLRPDVFPKGM